MIPFLAGDRLFQDVFDTADNRSAFFDHRWQITLNDRISTRPQPRTLVKGSIPHFTAHNRCSGTQGRIFPCHVTFICTRVLDAVHIIRDYVAMHTPDGARNDMIPKLGKSLRRHGVVVFTHVYCFQFHTRCDEVGSW